MSEEKSFERFARDVRMHNMIVIKDDNGYRHLRFKRPRTNSYYFDLVTWPGYLCMTGDMGTWTFSRIDDMFEFFRNDSGRINPGYWSEKLEAGTGCPRDKIALEWDEARFRKVMDECLSDWIEGHKPDDDDEDPEYEEKLEEVKDLVQDMKRGSYSEHEAYAVYAAADDPHGILIDFWESTFKTYSVHYLWACYAIVWGIERYDLRAFAHKSMSTFLACRLEATHD